MFIRIVLTALAAGFAAGVFLWVGHMIETTPLILAAEVYETGAALETAPGGGFKRAVLTLLADVLTSIGFAFLLTGVVSLLGRDVDWRQGIVWGLCGFAAFFAAPSLGLAPELPGMQAADLGARQVWWLASAVATAVGLGLLILSTGTHIKVLGAVLIILPHVIGAPSHGIAYGEAAGRVPAELASEFAIAVFVVTGLFWIVLGGLVGYFYNRFQQA